jgi:dGTPase
MRTICDFVAGMTDRYAMEFYARLRGRRASDNAQAVLTPPPRAFATIPRIT